MSDIKLGHDITTLKYIHSVDEGLYAKLFKIKNIGNVRKNNDVYSSLYFSIYYDAPLHATRKDYRCNVYVVNETYYNIRLEDLTPTNLDFEIIAIDDGVYTIFYVSSPGLNYDGYSAELKLTKMTYYEYIEAVQISKFDVDIDTLLSNNPTYKLTRAETYNLNIKDNYRLTKDSFVTLGATVGYTKIFSLDFSDVITSTYASMIFSTTVYGNSTASDRNYLNTVSIRVGYNISSGITIMDGAIIVGTNSNGTARKIPVVLLQNGDIVNIYLNHTETSWLSAFVNVQGWYAHDKNIKINYYDRDTGEIITTLPTYESMVVI